MNNVSKRLATRAGVVFTLVLLVALAAGAWISSAAPTVPEPPTALCDNVGPLYGESADPFQEVPSGDSSYACGVFNTCGWGTLHVFLRDYEECTTNDLTILCMNDKGQWVNNTVKNVALSADGTVVTFDSTQDLTCGLFPSGAQPNALQGPVINSDQ